MENSFIYYKWFQKVMSVFLDIFFVVAPLASLYVFTSVFSGVFKYALYGLLILDYCTVIYFLRDKIKNLLKELLNRIDQLDEKKMMMIIGITFVVLKILFTVFFYFDPTQGGDIKIYNDIADHILETGDIHSDAISHLYGIALHLVLFKLIKMPIHIGLFIAIFIGTIFNFLSFKKIIGKNKAFLVTMIYIVMPSTVLFTFCPTHEIFVYFYISLYFYFFNRFIGTKSFKESSFYVLPIIVLMTMTCFVNPGGYLLYVIIILAILLSSLPLNKKIVIGICLLASILMSNGIFKYLNVNEYSTTINTYTILLHGSNPDALGEQVDGYPLKLMRKWIHENTLDFSQEGFVEAAKHVLIKNYVFLLTHPLSLIKLIVHKVYILWSGVFYPIEMARHYDGLPSLLYYLFLIFNTFLYLFVLSVGLVFNKRKDDKMDISNYKLELLGVIALTLLCIVLNKYSVYVTIFLYLVAFYRAEIDE